MNTDILKEIDAEIARLQRARELLAGDSLAKRSSMKTPSAAPVRKKRKLSAEARRRIAEAQRRRWAKIKGKAAA